MAEQTRAPTPNQASVTVFESEEEVVQQDVRSVRLKLRKPKSKKQVQWCSGTVDNEHLNKKKSKCCCQYEKPRAFDESSSESEDEECEHCFGHVEKKKKHKQHAKETEKPTEDVTLCEVHEHPHPPVPESNSSEPDSSSPGNPDQSPSN